MHRDERLHKAEQFIPELLWLIGVVMDTKRRQRGENESPTRRAAGVTPAPSEKRKVARGALLCSTGAAARGEDKGVMFRESRATSPLTPLPSGEGNQRMRDEETRNLTPNPFPSRKGDRI